MNRDWQRILRVTLAVFSFGMASALAYDALAGDCCAPGAACCQPGAPCCGSQHHKPQG
jgi:hypothetical protein